MDCFPDFCIGCDSQAVDGFYCSETCRMADIERSSVSIPSSPSGSFASHHSAFHFAQPRKASGKAAGRTTRAKSADETAPAPQRVLTPSSSRSSLTSNGNDAVSEEAVKELLNYFNAFDRTRDQRRKSVPLSQQSHNWGTSDGH